jgi:hypothetical protein
MIRKYFLPNKYSFKRIGFVVNQFLNDIFNVKGVKKKPERLKPFGLL